MATIYDIAAKANVSAMTVSRVINDTGKVSEKTRAKVRKVMEELHYVPNQTARSLVLQQTRTLFLLIADIMNPFYTTLARGAEDAARANGYRLLFGNSDESLNKEAEYIDTILTTRADGALIAPAGDPSLPHMEKLRTHNVPVVLLDREVPGMACDIVLGDSKEGSRQLVQHLLDQGHRSIAIVNGSSSISSARDRLAGYMDAMKQNNLPVDACRIHETSFGPINDLTAMEDWFVRLNPKPTAIVAGNNVLAAEMLRLLHARGLNVPQDISLVCFDDFGPFSEPEPFMTVARQQAYQFGYMGTQLLCERIEDREGKLPNRRIVLPADLVVRRSVRPIK